MDLIKTANENLEVLVMGDELESSLKFVQSNIYIKLLPAIGAYEQQEHAIDHFECLMEMSSHAS